MSGLAVVCLSVMADTGSWSTWLRFDNDASVIVIDLRLHGLSHHGCHVMEYSLRVTATGLRITSYIGYNRGLFSTQSNPQDPDVPVGCVIRMSCHSFRTVMAITPWHRTSITVTDLDFYVTPVPSLLVMLPQLLIRELAYAALPSSRIVLQNHGALSNASIDLSNGLMSVLTVDQLRQHVTPQLASMARQV